MGSQASFRPSLREARGDVVLKNAAEFSAPLREACVNPIRPIMAQARRGSRAANGGGNGRRRTGARDASFRTEAQVWHDPLLKPAGARSGSPDVFVQAASPTEDARPVVAVKRVARLVGGPKPVTDPKEQERQRLLARVLTAEGRALVTRAVDDYLGKSFELPRTQAVWLQMLEHRDEAKVAQAIETLHAILADAEVGIERRAVLESRLRQIEELADESTTRTVAGALRRFLQLKVNEAMRHAVLADSDDAPVSS